MMEKTIHEYKEHIGYLNEVINHYTNSLSLMDELLIISEQNKEVLIASIRKAEEEDARKKEKIIELQKRLYSYTVQVADYSDKFDRVKKERNEAETEAQRLAEENERLRIRVICLGGNIDGL